GQEIVKIYPYLKGAKIPFPYEPRHVELPIIPINYVWNCRILNIAIPPGRDAIRRPTDLYND
ncbi:MAG TPA: hypothetical protein PL107_05120, partial [Candidatus Marinimicrobia bacterium]|nr:hypothetical protein [Candidatus Neomarinimicrobiota bacterium]